MSELLEFLTACLDETYLEANAWRATEDDPGEMDFRWYKVPTYTPARVLADVEAKRQIIAEHSPQDYESEEDNFAEVTFCVTCSYTGGAGGTVGGKYPCTTLRLLALPYADHADYREEWRP